MNNKGGSRVMNNLEKADLVLSSNAVFTGLEEKPQPASIAIKNNKIVAVASKEEVKSWIGPNTKTLDYDDQLIMPGFHDNHLHVMMGSLALDSVNLFSARSKEEAVEMIRQFAEKRPDEKWVIGYTWDSGYWDNQSNPTKESLDEILPDRPAIMFHAEGHYAWVNSKGLEKMGINNETENPEYGEIEKDEFGEPTGILYEKAMALITEDAYDLPREKKEEIFKEFMQHAASLGVTAVSDLYGSESLSVLDDYGLFKEFNERNQLTMRIHLWPALDHDIEKAKQLRESFDSPTLSVKGLKQFVDGVITARTAYMLEPYSDKLNDIGGSSLTKETFYELIAAADKEGFAVRLHSIGDGAIRLALDAYENAQTLNGRRDSRHSVEHVEVIHKDDIPRFKELGVVASMQPNHFAMSERGVYTDRIGEERSKNVFAINQLKEAGAKLSFGTDFPIDELNPMGQIYRAISRVDNSGVNKWNPEEGITLSEALKAYTNAPAHSTFREHELGTLEVGKLADIIVLDKNLFNIPEEEIVNTKVSLTVFDGEIIFDSNKE